MQPNQTDVPFEPTLEERHDMVAVAAYFLAEKRGFPGSGALDDWIDAERQIDKMLQGMANQGATRRSLERVGLRNALSLWG